jgi:HlyD family secretion protein
MTRKILTLLALLAVAALIAYGLVQAGKPMPLQFQGQIEADQIAVAPKVTGRVLKVLVVEGQMIAAGAQLIELDAPEIEAKAQQAGAARDAAKAVSDKAQGGARQEEIRMAQLNAQRAKIGADLAETSFKRIDGLARDGLIAAQKRDEAEANWRSNVDLARAADTQYRLALAGARVEDKAAAAAQLRQASGAVAEVGVAQRETQLVSPVAGEVTKVNAKVGELSPAGVPVVTVSNLAVVWAVVNVREDLLPGFQKGQRFTATVPALGLKAVEFEVYALAAQPDFATWRASPGGTTFDAKTFEIKARPVQPLAGARPGMSVVVTAKP